MYKIFVSYAQPEIQWAEYLKNILSGTQVKVFVAEYDINAGDILSEEITTAIKQCDLFVLLWSKNANESRYVGKEIFLAKAEKKKILPILLQRNVPMPPELGDVKYLDLVNKHSEDEIQWLKDYVSDKSSDKATGQIVALGILVLVGAALISSSD